MPVCHISVLLQVFTSQTRELVNVFMLNENNSFQELFLLCVPVNYDCYCTELAGTFKPTLQKCSLTVLIELFAILLEVKITENLNADTKVGSESIVKSIFLVCIQ